MRKTVRNSVNIYTVGK